MRHGRCLVRDDNGASTPIFLDRKNGEPRLKLVDFFRVAYSLDNAPDNSPGPSKKPSRPVCSSPFLPQVIAFRLVKSDFRSAADHPAAPNVSPGASVAAAMLGASPKRAETLLVDFGRKRWGFCRAKVRCWQPEKVGAVRSVFHVQLCQLCSGNDASFVSGSAGQPEKHMDAFIVESVEPEKD